MSLTFKQLHDDGCRENPHMPLFGGFWFCFTCKTYERHYAMSHIGDSDCYAVCNVCHTYTGRQELRKK